MTAVSCTKSSSLVSASKVRDVAIQCKRRRSDLYGYIQIIRYFLFTISSKVLGTGEGYELSLMHADSSGRREAS
jgi:hypothetical protein